MAEVTHLLDLWRQGDDAAMDSLLHKLYQELRVLAMARLKGEQGYHTLQPTALLHETYLRLLVQNKEQLKNRAQFFALASRMMRRILVDHARAKKAKKRAGSKRAHACLDDIPQPQGTPPIDPLVLDDALAQLAEWNPELCLLVELKHFGGFSMQEVSHILSQPPSSVYRRWQLARAFLHRCVKGETVE